MNTMTNLTMEHERPARAVDLTGGTGRVDLGQAPANIHPGLLALARFGLAMLREHRSSFGVGDIDGGAAQEQATAAGLIEAKTLDAPCGEHCECAGVDDFPLECFVTTEATRVASAWLDAQGNEIDSHAAAPEPVIAANAAPAADPSLTAVIHPVGESFQQGEVWMSPRGMLWRVEEQLLVPGKKLQVVLRLGDVPMTGGRKVMRNWDAVTGWVLYRHKNGSLTRAAGSSNASPAG